MDKRETQIGTHILSSLLEGLVSSGNGLWREAASHFSLGKRSPHVLTSHHEPKARLCLFQSKAPRGEARARAALNESPVLPAPDLEKIPRSQWEASFNLAVAQKMCQNGTLVNGTKDQNLRNPCCFNLEPHPFGDTSKCGSSFGKEPAALSKRETSDRFSRP